MARDFFLFSCFKSTAFFRLSLSLEQRYVERAGEERPRILDNSSFQCLCDKIFLLSIFFFFPPKENNQQPAQSHQSFFGTTGCDLCLPSCFHITFQTVLVSPHYSQLAYTTRLQLQVRGRLLTQSDVMHSCLVMYKIKR